MYWKRSQVTPLIAAALLVACDTPMSPGSGGEPPLSHSRSPPFAAQRSFTRDRGGLRQRRA